MTGRGKRRGGIQEEREGKGRGRTSGDKVSRTDSLALRLQWKEEEDMRIGSLRSRRREKERMGEWVAVMLI